MWGCTIDKHTRSQNLHHFDSDMGSNWGSSGFPCNHNNCGSSSAYVTCIYCSLSVKINKMPHGAQRSWTHLYYVCFSMCGQQKPEDPQFEPMADDTITQGSIGGLGSPMYICGLYRVVSDYYQGTSYLFHRVFPYCCSYTYKTKLRNISPFRSPIPIIIL